MSTDYFAVQSGTPIEPGRMVTVDQDLPRLELASGIVARALLGSNLLVSFVRWQPHALAPLHAHAEEQVFVVLEGQLEITLGREVRLMGPGEAAHIPAWVEHSVRSFDTPAYQIDVFDPPRQAFLDLLAQVAARPAGSEDVGNAPLSEPSGTPPAP